MEKEKRKSWYKITEIFKCIAIFYRTFIFVLNNDYNSKEQNTLI